MLQRKLLGVLALTLSACSAREQQIDQTYTYSADLTRDGSAELVTVHMSSPDIRRPFRWSVLVTDSAKTRLALVERDDAELDEFFSDLGKDGYIPGCPSYEDCKRLYYFKLIPEQISRCLEHGHTAHFVSGLGGNDNSLEVASQFLQEQHVEPSLIQEALRELKEVLRADTTLSLCIPLSGVIDDPPMVWLKSIGRFVPYYAP